MQLEGALASNYGTFQRLRDCLVNVENLFLVLKQRGTSIRENCPKHRLIETLKILHWPTSHFPKYLTQGYFFPTAPLKVKIGLLSIVRIEMGHPLTLNCTVRGGPVKSIEWLHNGRPINFINSDGSRVRLLSREVLYIGKVTHTDRGMYQCIAENQFESAQAQVQLELVNVKANYQEEPVWSRPVNRPERDSGQ